MATKLNTDQTVTEQVLSGGICKDVARHLIPAGSVYDSVDFMLERPGVAYKRGGWERHSAVLGASTSVAAVATIHIPTRVVAVGSNGTLYDVTSESSPQATSIGACFAPGENPPLYIDRLIFCDPTAAAAPKKVYWNGGGSTIAVANLGGSPPAAAHSTIYASRIVLGRSTTAAGNLNRIWFSPLPNVESTWDTANFYLDVTNEITGFAPVQGVLLVFSPTGFERIIGGVPPGEEGENMQLQPVDGGVGCLDARSIVHIAGGEVVFAGEQGVFATNGGAPRSLLEKPDGSGLQSYWRSLFPAHQIRQVVAGLLARDFYVVSILDASNAEVDGFICHLPSERWTRVTNMGARMFAGGRTEQESSELYMAAAGQGYVERLSSILKPTWANKADGDGNDVLPVLDLRPVGGSSPSLKAFGHAHVTYAMTVGVATAWQATHVYTMGTQIREQGAVWEITGRTGDFKSGSTEPDWAAYVDGIGNPVTDNHVTWTNMGPQLVPYRDVTVSENGRSIFYATTTPQRERFNVNSDAREINPRLQQSGPSATTEIYALEVVVRSYDDESESA